MNAIPGQQPHNSDPITVARFGYELLADPLLNKGIAFDAAERDSFQLHGLLPPHIGTLNEQIDRRLQAIRALSSDLDRYVFLRDLQDTNETLYYALLEQNLEEFLPIVYTPTVGEGCQQFSRIYRKPRGLFLSYPNRHRISEILSQSRFDRIEAIVVTDGERILGLGDQGAGGMGIPIGKLALYTACAGLHPATTLPVLLDAGTDCQQCLSDPLYIGWRHERIRGRRYDDFIETFVQAVAARWPHVLLQWEDFGKLDANRLLDRYHDRLCTFNDDIQGTAAVATGALLSAIHLTGAKVTDQRIAVLGAGTAGCGIASLLLTAMTNGGMSVRDARRCFFLVDRDGLLVEGANNILPFQAPFVPPRETVSGWQLESPDRIGLLEVINNTEPTVLIGTSGQAGAFTESIVRTMARHVHRPVIFPLSNPSANSEATPSDILAWTDGRAVTGTGSPFAPVTWQGRQITIDQINNAYIFPGVGLGLVASQARRVSDAMFMQAATALAACSPSRQAADGPLLPPIASLREVSVQVALAVARQAQEEGLTDLSTDDELQDAIQGKIWTPRYRIYRRAD